MGARRDSAASDASENGTAVRHDQWNGEVDEYHRQRAIRVNKEKDERAKKSRYDNVPSREEQKRAAAKGHTKK